MRSLRFMGILFVVAVLLAACGGDDGEGSPDTGAEEAAATLELSAKGFAFKPDTLEATGTDFTINLSNGDEVEHNLTIEDLDVDEDADAGKSVEVSVTGAQAGTYEFFCEYHPDTMQGELSVSS
jgi:plastocyanin